MTREELNTLFSDLGWFKYRGDGSTVVTKRLKDRVVWDILIFKSPGYLTSGPCVSTDAFDLADAIISNSSKRIADQSIICQTQWSEFNRDFDLDDAKELSNKVIAWAMSQDVDAGLDHLKSLPTNCLGAMPVRHLAALAVSGDVDTLSRYRDHFSSGDRLNFVPYIDQDYIDRALNFARQRRDNPEWLPTTPKLRV